MILSNYTASSTSFDQFLSRQLYRADTCGDIARGALDQHWPTITSRAQLEHLVGPMPWMFDACRSLWQAYMAERDGSSLTHQPSMRCPKEDVWQKPAQ